MGLGSLWSALQWRCVKEAQVQQRRETGSERVLLMQMWMREREEPCLYWRSLRRHVQPGCSEEK